ncbi:hypothetical protein [Rhodococcoides fascians]|uniref:hypothetical protein n=1 Tax=Rhodococcoides fascians TaxID=1828 RepID=UPI00068A5C3D|nr:hypothetical protein [Rhodococcus fascians]
MAVTGADVIKAGAGRFDDEELADEKVAQVWDAVRSYCEWHISPVLERVELTVDGSGSPILQVPTLRLLAVHSVREEGEPVDPSRFMWSADGTLKKRVGCWTSEWRGVELVVDHGLEDVPALDGVVLEVATRAMTAPAGQIGLRVGQVDERFGATVGGFAFLATDYAKLDKYVVPAEA